MNRLFTVVTAIVVGTTVAYTQPLPDHLNIGANFPPVTATIHIEIDLSTAMGGGIYSLDPVVETNISCQHGESLGTVSQTTLTELARSFVPPYGQEGGEYNVLITVDDDLGLGVPDSGANLHAVPLAGQFIPRPLSWFRLIQTNGAWVIPQEMLKVKLGYESYMPFAVPGLKGVELVWTNIVDFGFTNVVDIRKEVSENGVSDRNCSLYPGNGNYCGPDVLQLHTTLVVPEKYSTGTWTFTGLTLTLRTTTDWATYDLNGNKVAEGPVLAVAISITEIASAAKLSAEGKTAVFKKAIKVAVKNTERFQGTPVVLESSDRLDGAWQEIAMLPDENGKYEFVDGSFGNPYGSARFYRARFIK